jgi:predicted protein tyrosine phosphatase
MFKYCFVLTLVTMDYTLKITDEIQRKHCVWINSAKVICLYIPHSQKN